MRLNGHVVVQLSRGSTILVSFAMPLQLALLQANRWHRAAPRAGVIDYQSGDYVRHNPYSASGVVREWCVTTT